MTGQGIRSFELEEYNRREILRYAQSPGCTDEGMLAVMEECIKECEDASAFSGRVSYTHLPILSLDTKTGVVDLELMKLESRSLAGNLDGCREVVVFAATVGPTIDRMIRKYNKLDPVKALFMQALGAERVETLCNMFCASFPNKMRPRFSPGFGDLSLEIQPQVLAVTNARKNLAITLDAGFLMSPSKSVTAFVGIDGDK